MNILYIGPYKNSNILYNASKDIIYDINNNDNIKDLTIRPVYINGFDNNTKISDLLINNICRKNLKNYYDIIIQHAPINIIANAKNLCAKSIVIPLFSKILGSNDYYEPLIYANEIYTDSTDFTDFLCNNLSINAKTFSYTGIYNTSNDISLSMYENTTKFYSIFQEYDEYLFSTTIRAFYQSFGDNDNISLIIIFNLKNKQTISSISDKFAEIKKNLGIKSNIFNVQVIIREMSFEEIIGIHKKCDIFIDIESANIYTKINRYLADQNGNKVIIDHNIINDIQIYESDRNKLFTTISINELSNAMNQNIIDNTNTKSFINYPSISSLICH